MQRRASSMITVALDRILDEMEGALDAPRILICRFVTDFLRSQTPWSFSGSIRLSRTSMSVTLPRLPHLFKIASVSGSTGSGGPHAVLTSRQA